MTSTSYERSSFGIYSDTEMPSYSILSYTRGARWMVTGDLSVPRLPVKGIPWVVPAVKAEHFSVAAFQNVLDQLASADEGYEWGWLDISCFDQESIRRMKM